MHFERFLISSHSLSLRPNPFSEMKNAYSCRLVVLTQRDGQRKASCGPRTGIESHDVLDATSVTRLGDLLDFGQLFKAFVNN